MGVVGGEPVQRRALHNLIPVAAEHVAALIVRKEEDHVRPVCQGRPAAQDTEQQEGKSDHDLRPTPWLRRPRPAGIHGVGRRHLQAVPSGLSVFVPTHPGEDVRATKFIGSDDKRPLVRKTAGSHCFFFSFLIFR